tara:strand:- start:10574 stop:10948 length:375 start_codon:yes stop_codon:yes gene_type:complete
MQWFELKNWLELSTGLDRDSLHIYAGVGVQLAVAVILRRSLASPVPWLFAVCVALANEYYDYSFISVASSGAQQAYDEAVRDIWNTLLLPSVLWLIARFFPEWLTGKRKQGNAPDRSDEIASSN